MTIEMVLLAIGIGFIAWLLCGGGVVQVHGAEHDRKCDDAQGGAEHDCHEHIDTDDAQPAPEYERPYQSAKMAELHPFTFQRTPAPTGITPINGDVEIEVIKVKSAWEANVETPIEWR